ncbi:hypothetical protein HYU15_00190 [Candidatus Woesearchaeota archaeon]|nr:hypothetical protein [Candidatus Woesearchaeota archaeon]
MPHQCVRCNTFYEESAAELLKGCSCGGRLFFFIKKEKLEAMKAATLKLSEQEKVQIEKDVLDIIGEDEQIDEPVVLDLETIRILKPGKYELDLVQLMKNEPLIYKVDEGKYLIDLIRSFGGGKK